MLGERRNSYDLDFTAWQAWCADHKLPAYRAEQIYTWHAKGITSFHDMSNIPIAIRTLLDASFYAGGLSVREDHTSAIDGTRKWLFNLHDGQTIESVLMQYDYGRTVCISSQAGCRMGCSFCASAYAGFGRNLSSGEMLAQVALAMRFAGERVSRVVVMGIGEPLDNRLELVRFLRRLNDPQGLGIGLRHVTVSTCGIVPEMVKFAEENLPVTLSVSLHAPNQTVRLSLMPIAKRWPYDELLRACDAYQARSGRRLTFEYALFRDINDQERHARELASNIRHLRAHVNLIPANDVPGSPLQKSTPDAVKRFIAELEKQRIRVTVRRELGADIMAACGQLRRKKNVCKTC